jgi:hypothetical protein
MSPSSTQINDESLAYPNGACGFAAFLAESLWLSVSHVPALRLRRGGAASSQQLTVTESQRLSARDPAKPPHENLRRNLNLMISELGFVKVRIESATSD